MQGKVSGFTIVELVVVIILLGILAATALPRFIDIDEDRHEAAFAGIHGSLQKGISLFHAQWLAQGQAAANSTFVDFNSLRNNAKGFPYGLDDNSGVGSDVADSDDCADVFSNVMQAGGPSVADAADLASVPAAGASVDFVAVEAAGLCNYYYTAETNVVGEDARTLEYNSANGQVTAGLTKL